MGRRVRALAAAIACAAGACLFPSLDGLSGGGDASLDTTTDTAQGGDAADSSSGNDANDASTSDAACPAPEANLVLYFKLDEGAGPTAHDCSGNARDGFMLSGGNGNWSVGHDDAGASLSIGATGKTGCINVGSFPVISGDFTLAFWVLANTYPPDGGNKQYIASKTFSFSTAGWRFATSDTPSYDFGIVKVDGGSFEANTPVLAPGAWTHLATVYTAATALDTYVNGALSTHHANAPALIEDAVAAFRVGCRGDNGDYFDGLIDEVRVYDRALTAAEIAALAAK